MSGFGGLRIGLKIVARNPCPEHSYAHWDGLKGGQPDSNAGCQGGLIGITNKEYDMGTGNFTSMIITQIFNTPTTGTPMTDSTGTAWDGTALMTPGTFEIGAGTGTTAPSADDYIIESEIVTGIPNPDSPTAALITGTVTRLPVIGPPYTSSITTITGTFNNTSLANETYGNIGIYVILASLVAGPTYFLLAHDQTNGAAGYVVSPAGTVGVTYTITVT
jgi:hypothetical protein